MIVLLYSSVLASPIFPNCPREVRCVHTLGRIPLSASPSLPAANISIVPLNNPTRVFALFDCSYIVYTDTHSPEQSFEGVMHSAGLDRTCAPVNAPQQQPRAIQLCTRATPAPSRQRLQGSPLALFPVFSLSNRRLSNSLTIGFPNPSNTQPCSQFVLSLSFNPNSPNSTFPSSHFGPIPFHIPYSSTKMVPRTNVITGLAVLALFSFARGVVLSSPEPEMDPMVPLPALYVVSAGHDSMRGPLLTDGSKICPGDYPIGFSILCDAPSTAESARFFVDGEFIKSEYHMPFHMAGDYKMRVNPWTSYPEKGILTCKLADGETVSAMVSFTC